MSQATLELQPGQLFWLNDSTKFYKVREGQIELYAVTAPDAPQYRQVFIDTCEVGRLLFALPSDDENAVQLMAVTALAATLEVIDRSQLGAGGLTPDMPEQVKAWLVPLLSSVDGPVAPRQYTDAVPGTSIPMSTGENLRTSRDLVWLSVQQGKLAFSSLGEYTLDDPIPLTTRSWLTAKVPSNVRIETTTEVLTTASCLAAVWEIIDKAHRLFAALQYQWFCQADEKDRDRLALRLQLQEKMLSSAAQHLVNTELSAASRAVSADAVASPLLQLARVMAIQLDIPEQQVRMPAGVEPSRRDIHALRQTMRLANMQLRPVALEPGWYNSDNGPLIAFQGKERRLIALLPQTPSSYLLFDPELNEIGELTAEAAESMHPLAYAVLAGLPERKLSLFELLAFTLKKCWTSDLWHIVLISIVAGIIPILTPLVTQTIFEDIIPINNRLGLVMVVQVMMVTAFVTAGVSFARAISFLRVKGRAQLTFESALWLRLLSLPASFFRRYQAGELTQRLSGVTQLSYLLSSSVMAGIFNAIFSFWSLLVMLYYSAKLAAVAAACWLIYLMVAGLLQWQMVAVKRQVLAATGKTAGQVLQIFNGLSKFRIQGAEANAFYLWAKCFGRQWTWNAQFRWRANWLELVYSLQPVLLTMVVFGLTMHWMEADKTTGQPFITLPEFMAFNAAMIGFNATLTSTVSLVAGLLDVVPLVERLKPILETEPEIAGDRIDAGELSGRIELSNVAFRYRTESPLVLRDVSLAIQPGQFAAFVGASGSGKSTLLRLLLGFEQPESGAVYYDGQDLAELNMASVRSQLGVVLQNSQLMSGDILTNIIGSLPLTIDDAWQAAEMVGLADDIRAMPMGMNTVISEGAANISGGQRQRILIARSLVHRPRIILFDEATSALDNRTQAIVTESISRMKATRIVVAHRLSTVMNADVIFVVDRGQIVEQGSYEELMNRKGLFAALADRQIA